MLAGSCIGVVLLVMSLEFLRRLSREYDNYIAGRSRRCSPASQSTTVAPKGSDGDGSLTAPLPTQPSRILRSTLLQHPVRSFLHMVQFGVAYMIMLLAMYYNGYFIICILIGSFLWWFVFSWGRACKKVGLSLALTCPSLLYLYLVL